MLPESPPGMPGLCPVQGAGLAGADGVEIKMSKSKLSKSTRDDQLRKLLLRKTGASIAQIQKSFGWQPHTARAAISRLRKSGSVVDREDGDKGSVYRIVLAGASK